MKKKGNGCKKLEIECVTCCAKGVIPTEEPEKWLICPNCKGSGSKIVELTLFTGRMLASGVVTVLRDGNDSKGVGYEDFLAGERP
ncbi:MAG: hypothetical protein ACWGHO_01065 [Candidatus Moraniibacteriota bacterium]